MGRVGGAWYTATVYSFKNVMMREPLMPGPFDQRYDQKPSPRWGTPTGPAREERQPSPSPEQQEGIRRLALQIRKDLVQAQSTAWEAMTRLRQIEARYGKPEKYEAEPEWQSCKREADQLVLAAQDLSDSLRRYTSI